MRKTSLTNHLKAHLNIKSRSIYRNKRQRLKAAAALKARVTVGNNGDGGDGGGVGYEGVGVGYDRGGKFELNNGIGQGNIGSGDGNNGGYCERNNGLNGDLYKQELVMVENHHENGGAAGNMHDRLVMQNAIQLYHQHQQQQQQEQHQQQQQLQQQQQHKVTSLPHVSSVVMTNTNIDPIPQLPQTTISPGGLPTILSSGTMIDEIDQNDLHNELSTMNQVDDVDVGIMPHTDTDTTTNNVFGSSGGGGGDESVVCEESSSSPFRWSPPVENISDTDLDALFWKDYYDLDEDPMKPPSSSFLAGNEHDYEQDVDSHDSSSSYMPFMGGP